MNYGNNSFMGYRSRRSRINDDTWEFAQKYSAGVSKKLILPSILLVLPMILFMRSGYNVIGFTAMGIVSLQMIFGFSVIIFFTEKALKTNFDSRGRRRYIH